MEFEKINIAEVVHLNYADSMIAKLMEKEQVSIQIDKIKFIKETKEVISINLAKSRYLDEEREYNLYFTYSKGGNTFKLDKDKIYLTELGVLIYDRCNAQWDLCFYKVLNEKNTYIPLREHFQPVENEYNKYECKPIDINNAIIDFGSNCWECGSELANGRCIDCGCSDEINL